MAEDEDALGAAEDETGRGIGSELVRVEELGDYRSEALEAVFFDSLKQHSEEHLRAGLPSQHVANALPEPPSGVAAIHCTCERVVGLIAHEGLSIRPRPFPLHLVACVREEQLTADVTDQMPALLSARKPPWFFLQGEVLSRDPGGTPAVGISGSPDLKPCPRELSSDPLVCRDSEDFTHALVSDRPEGTMPYEEISV